MRLVIIISIWTTSGSLTVITYSEIIVKFDNRNLLLCSLGVTVLHLLTIFNPITQASNLTKIKIIWLFRLVQQIFNVKTIFHSSPCIWSSKISYHRLYVWKCQNKNDTDSNESNYDKLQRESFQITINKKRGSFQRKF